MNRQTAPASQVTTRPESARGLFLLDSQPPTYGLLLPAGELVLHGALWRSSEYLGLASGQFQNRTASPIIGAAANLDLGRGELEIQSGLTSAGWLPAETLCVTGSPERRLAMQIDMAIDKNTEFKAGTILDATALVVRVSDRYPWGESDDGGILAVPVIPLPHFNPATDILCIERSRIRGVMSEDEASGLHLFLVGWRGTSKEYYPNGEEVKDSLYVIAHDHMEARNRCVEDTLRIGYDTCKIRFTRQLDDIREAN